MSHLIIEQGAEVGKEIAVPPEGIKFGRSPANDLVLEDAAVMLFQGRFFFKSDGTLWITDFSAADKTTVDGKPVDEQVLKVGALVEVGGTAFRVIGIKEAVSEQPAEEIDLGFKASEKESAGGSAGGSKVSLVHRVLQGVVAVLVLIILAVVWSQFMNKEGASSATKQLKGLSVVYESIRGDASNIFRYHFELAEDGTAVLNVDDLKSRHITKKVKVPARAIENLSRRLGSSGFFDVESDRVMDAPNRYEFYDLAIVRNGQFNQVRILNREPSSEIKDTVSLLEEFVLNELDVPFTLLEEPDTLLRLALDAFKLGENRFAERDVEQGNLAEAIKHYHEASVYLEVLEPKPELFRQSQVKMEQAKAEQTARYKDYMFNVERAMRLGEWREAATFLNVLAELIPDRKDERYKIISSKQLDVEDHLR